METLLILYGKLLCYGSDIYSPERERLKLIKYQNCAKRVKVRFMFCYVPMELYSDEAD